MMRSTFLAVFAAGAAFAGGAAAQPTVTVTIGPELQAKARIYGQRELDSLAADLQHHVATALARGGEAAPQAGDLRLELVDAKPNRPTVKQLGDTPGLSLSSFGIGGAEIRGVLTSPDGSTRDVHYRWYESDIRYAAYQGIWGDAEYTFGRFADALAHGRYTVR